MGIEPQPPRIQAASVLQRKAPFIGRLNCSGAPLVSYLSGQERNAG
jgi:hypothetical protein